jgi:hypothetical protein
MLDPILLVEAMAAAALIAAAVTFFCGWLRQSAGSVWTLADLGDLGAPLGVAAGFYVGCWLLQVKFRLSFREDQDRLLLIVFPAIVLVEVAAAFLGKRWRFAWLLRLLAVAGAARALLHDSTFIADHESAAREWGPVLTWKILGGLAIALAVAWSALSALAQKRSRQSVPLALALACAGSAVTVMLSGYASGGMLGLPLAAALTGYVVAASLMPNSPNPDGAVGLGIVGLFSILVIGRFFGELTTANAMLLFAAPLLCWLPELPRRFQGLARLGIAAVPIVAVVVMVLLKFEEDSNRAASRVKEPLPGTVETSAEHYLNFKK